MFEKFSDGTRRALTHAKEAARLRDADEISPAHVLLGLTASEAEASSLLAGRGITTAVLEPLLAACVPVPRIGAGDPIPFSEASKAVLVDAVRLATTSEGLDAVRTPHLLAAVTACDEAELAAVKGELHLHDD